MSAVLSLTAALLGLAAGAAPPANPTVPVAAPVAAPAVRVLRTGGLKVESAALLVSGEQGGSIHVAVLPQLFPGVPGAGGQVRVPVVLEIDGATLLKGNPGDLVRIEICLYALAANGSVEGSLLETIEIDLARAGPAVGQSGVQYAGELSLPPGEHSLRVLVRNALTGEVGLRILPLTVPDTRGQGGPLLLPPAFPNPAPGAWLAALSKAAQASPAALADGALPAAQPVLGVDQEARFELPVWKLPATDSLRVEVLRPDGARVTDLPARIAARREAAGVARLTVAFVPAGLEPGRYLLRPRVPGFEKAPAWASFFVLLDFGKAGNGGKVWAELLHAGDSPREAATAAGAAPGAGPARRRRRRLDAAPVRAAYRQALALLAAGDAAAARRAVAALETSRLAGVGSAVLEASEELAEIELGVAHDLAAVAARSLLPIAILHAGLDREAEQRRELALSTHSREMVAALADLYARRSGDAAGRRMAARLLLGLAAQLVRSAPPGLCGACTRTLEQALDLDAEDAAAHLYLAISAEHQGRYPHAVSELELLLRSHPDNAEARVRLAVNLRRLGKTRDADRLLAGLIQGPAAVSETAEPWVLALAYHETGRALLAAGRLDDAERVLREGLRRLPDDEKLLLELAGVFDLRHEPGAARQVLAGFKPAHGTAESARHRYSRPPAEALERSWDELERTLPESLPALAAALQAAAKASPRRGS